jgi:membrane protease YdiL (CAAX protease family)
VVDQQRRTRRTEILLVLALSLGASAVYSVVSLVAKLTARGGLAAQTATLNGSLSNRPYLDLTYQLLGIGFGLVPAFLALFLLNGDAAGLGLDRRRAGFDLAAGAGLAALIGLPGLGLYFAARELGLNATVVPSALPRVWWAVPILVLSAVQNAVLEEVVAVGYLQTRLRQLGSGLVAVVLASAVLRGAYHLYQGFGAFVGSVVMGVVFSVFFVRTGRLLPLVIAHTLIDIAAFVGYPLLRGHLSLLP